MHDRTHGAGTTEIEEQDFVNRGTGRAMTDGSSTIETEEQVFVNRGTGR
jgi:hypothetical protein